MKKWVVAALVCLIVAAAAIVVFQAKTDKPAPEVVPPAEVIERPVVGGTQINVLLTTQFFEPKTLVVPKDNLVRIYVTSVDADHAIQVIGQLPVQIPKGQTRDIEIYTTTNQQNYTLICNEYCEPGVQLFIEVQQ